MTYDCEGIPEFTRPTMGLSRHDPFWQTLQRVHHRLRVAGLGSKAQEFVKRATTLGPADTIESRWELCLLALEYVRFPEDLDETG